MSDDRIISLRDRRAEPRPRLSGCLVFANDQLRMPMEVGATGPEWTTIEPVMVQLEGQSEPVAVHARFGMLDHSPDGTAGRVSGDEHSVSAALYFPRDLFDAFQSAALSPTPLTLFVTFGSRDNEPPLVTLAIERRTA